MARVTRALTKRALEVALVGQQKALKRALHRGDRFEVRRAERAITQIRKDMDSGTR